MVARAPPGLPLCRCAPGRARCWEIRPASWRDPGAAPARSLLPGAARGALTLHQPGPFPPQENAAGAGIRAWVVRISTWVELRWVLFGQTGARALSGLAVLESGLGAPRASTLPLDPQRLITFFSALER